MPVAVIPRSRISASSECTCGASGVVRCEGMGVSPARISMVPISPVVWPRARRIEVVK